MTNEVTSDGSNRIVNVDRTVPFRETIERFRAALKKKCRFRVRARKFYGTMWIADCYTDYSRPSLFRSYYGPLMEGLGLRSMGKGLSRQQATAGALAEAVERISFFEYLASGRQICIYELTPQAELAASRLSLGDVPHLDDTADGVSAGNTVNECVFHGLLEMHEHSDVHLHMGRPGLEHRQLIDPWLTGFRPAVAGRMLAVWVPGPNPSVTTVHAVMCPKDLGPLVRTCSHLDGQVALQRALNETLQSHKTRRIRDLQVFAADADIRELPNHLSEDLVEDIRAVMRGMSETIYVQDWTDPEMQVPVLRPFSLQMTREAYDFGRVERYVETMRADASRYIVW